MTDNQALLTPDLTMGRIARKLQVPEKQLSAAINDFQMDHACQLLSKGASVTSAMYASGFNTKSNFNREFQRVKGCSPSHWLGLENQAQVAQ